MDGSCQHKALCRCHGASEIAESVKSKIELCIQMYMSLQETADYLKENHQISHNLTKTIWEQLRKENPDFFNNYYSRCKTASQTKKLNSLLAKQLALMKQYGFFDTFDASRTYNTETMHTQLNGSFTGRPTSDNHLGAPTMAPAATDFAYDYPGLPAYTPAATTQWPSCADLSYSGAQTVAVAATMQQDPSTFGFRGYTGYNGLRSQYTDMESAAQLFMQPNAIHGLDGIYPPHYGGSNGLQNGGNGFHNGEGSSGLQNGGGSNRFHYGEGSNRFHYGEGSNRFHYGEGSSGLQNGGGSNRFHNGEGSHGLQNGGGSNMFQNGEGSSGLQNGEGSGLQNGEGNSRLQDGGGSNGLQNGGSNGLQNGELGVKHRHPESEALKNPCVGHGTLKTARKQRRLQLQRRSLKKEPYQSEETKEICKQ